MQISAAQQNIQSGSCPHGMPPSACPICSGRRGGGAAASKPKEWSYQKCYAIGLQIKAAAQRREDAAAFGEKQLLSALQMNKNLQNIQNVLNQLIQNIKTPNLQGAVNTLMNAAAKQLLNTISQLNKLISQASDMQQKALNMLLQAGEKLVNILGEIKNSVQKQIFDNLKKKAKKFLLFCLSAIEDENYRNDDTLAVFKSIELKKYIVKILKKHKNDEHSTSENSKK